MNRDFKGVWIPKEIWLNEDLSPLDKCLLAEIDSLDAENECYASNEYLAKFCQVSEATIKRSVKKLCDLGLVETEMRTSDTGSYRVIKMIRPVGSNDRGSGQNDTTHLVNLTPKYISNSNIVNSSISKDILPYRDISENSEFSFGTEKKRKPNLYQGCISVINEYTDDINIRKTIGQYLDVCMEMKSIRGLTQWKGMLNTTLTKALENSDYGVTVQDIVENSIAHGWKTFYPIHDEYKNPTKSRDGLPHHERVIDKMADKARDANGNFIEY